jgi:hypothetical protein
MGGEIPSTHFSDITPKSAGEDPQHKVADLRQFVLLPFLPSQQQSLCYFNARQRKMGFRAACTSSSLATRVE